MVINEHYSINEHFELLTVPYINIEEEKMFIEQKRSFLFLILNKTT